MVHGPHFGGPVMIILVYTKGSHKNNFPLFLQFLGLVILETAVGRKKAVQDIGVHGEIHEVVVTSVVMRHFCFLRGACPRLAIVTREAWFESDVSIV